jgi:cytochrome c55X
MRFHTSAALLSCIAVGLAADANAQVGESLAAGARVDDAARGWATLRAMDCARCHGRDFDGLTAPSLLYYVRSVPREWFDRIVLEGDIGRGMPGYKSNPRVVADLDAIYAYLKTRADSPGSPITKPPALPTGH